MRLNRRLPAEASAPPLTAPDALAFEAFFASEYRAVAALVAVLTGSSVVGEDLAQEAFVAALARWGRISTYEDAGAWVRRVAVNRATSWWRRRTREAMALRRWLAREPVEVELLAGDPRFWDAVRALPARQAQCIALHYLEDRSVADIAAVLGVAEPTVRVHLHHGRSTLAGRLGERVDEVPDAD